MTFGEPNDNGGKTVSGLPALIPMVFWFAWLIIPESLWGTTLGHSLNGLKIVSFSGEKLNTQIRLQIKLDVSEWKFNDKELFPKNWGKPKLKSLFTGFQVCSRYKY